MGRPELVRIGDVEFFVEIAQPAGPEPARAHDVLSFDAMRDTIEAIASQLAQVWNRVRPSEASVEFGLEATVRSGKLTGLLVEGGGAAALKVTLSWKAEPPTVDVDRRDSLGGNASNLRADGPDAEPAAEPATAPEADGA